MVSEVHLQMISQLYILYRKIKESYWWTGKSMEGQQCLLPPKTQFAWKTEKLQSEYLISNGRMKPEPLNL